MRLVSLALIAVLAACGSPSPEVSTRGAPVAAYTRAAYAPAAYTVPATAPRFLDRDPHAWDGVTPWRYPVHGVDVSKWQGAVDWRAVRASGVAFAYIKATEGADHADEAFGANWRGAALAGVPRGAYHFYYFCRTANEQAAWFIRNVPREAGALPPVLDMEWNAQSRTCPQRPGPAVVREEMAVFIAAVTRHYRQRPVVYVTPDFYRENDLGRLAGASFWLRSVAGHPGKTYPGQDWAFWQYSGTGVVPGIDGPADLNAFAGSPAQWAAWLAANRL